MSATAVQVLGSTVAGALKIPAMPPSPAIARMAQTVAVSFRLNVHAPSASIEPATAVLLASPVEVDAPDPPW